MPPWLFQARSFFPACFRVSFAILGGGSPQISRIYRSITALQKGVQTPPFFHDFGHFWPPPNFDFREKPIPQFFCQKNSSIDEKYFSWSTISFSLSINKNIFASIDGCEENSSQHHNFCLKVCDWVVDDPDSKCGDGSSIISSEVIDDSETHLWKIVVHQKTSLSSASTSVKYQPHPGKK